MSWARTCAASGAAPGPEHSAPGTGERAGRAYCRDLAVLAPPPPPPTPTPPMGVQHAPLADHIADGERRRHAHHAPARHAQRRRRRGQHHDALQARQDARRGRPRQALRVGVGFGLGLGLGLQRTYTRRGRPRQALRRPGARARGGGSGSPCSLLLFLLPPKEAAGEAGAGAGEAGTRCLQRCCAGGQRGPGHPP